MRICLIEYENHSEVLRSLYHLFGDLGHHVVIYSHPRCLENLLDLPAEVRYSIEDYRQNDSFDLTLYITPFDYKKISQPIVPLKDSYLIIHNHNYWLNPRQNKYHLNFFTWKWPYFIAKYWKYWNPSTLRLNEAYLKEFKGVLSSTPWLYSAYASHPQLIGSIDIAYYRPIPLKLRESGKPITIVIPGKLSQEKNPTEVISYFAQYSEYKKRPIVLYLLGHNRFLSTSFIEKYNHEYFTVISYDQPVSQSTFDKIMGLADLGVLPITGVKNYKGIMEKTGISHASGSVHDMFRFQLPFLISAQNDLPAELSSFWKVWEGRRSFYQLLDSFIAGTLFNEAHMVSQYNVYRRDILEKTDILLDRLLNKE